MTSELINYALELIAEGLDDAAAAERSGLRVDQVAALRGAIPDGVTSAQRAAADARAAIDAKLAPGRAAAYAAGTSLAAVTIVDAYGGQPAPVPVIHRRSKGGHRAGLGVALWLKDVGDDRDERTVVDLAVVPAQGSRGKVEAPPAGGAWNMTCGGCGKRLRPVRTVELYELGLRALVARGSSRRGAAQTVTLT